MSGRTVEVCVFAHNVLRTAQLDRRKLKAGEYVLSGHRPSLTNCFPGCFSFVFSDSVNKS